MKSKIVELDLNEIEAVAGGVTYTATMTSSATLQSSYTAPTYVRLTYTSSYSSPLSMTAPSLPPPPTR